MAEKPIKVDERTDRIVTDLAHFLRSTKKASFETPWPSTRNRAARSCPNTRNPAATESRHFHHYSALRCEGRT